jgi:hypothetical protein
LEGAVSGRLVFASGAAWMNIHADPASNALAEGRFAGTAPGVQVEEGLVIVKTRRFPPLDRIGHGHGIPGEISLNTAVPWEIEFRGGASRISADLRGLHLRSFDVLGGASQILLALSKPAGTTFIYIAGGADQVTILRSDGAAVQLQAQEGMSHLTFDEGYYKTIPGESRLESPGYQNNFSRCDILIAGGANRLTIGYNGR